MWAGVVFVLLAGVPSSCELAAYEYYQTDSGDEDDLDVDFYDVYGEADTGATLMTEPMDSRAVLRIRRQGESEISTLEPSELQDVQGALKEILAGRDLDGLSDDSYESSNQTPSDEFWRITAPTRSVMTSKQITRTKSDLRVETLESSNRTPPDEFGGITTPTRSVMTSKEITRTKSDLRVETLETSNRTPPDEFGGITTPTRSVMTSKEITRTKSDLRVETLETSNRTPPDEFGGITTPTRSVMTSKEITRTKSDLRVETLETSNRTPPDEFGGIITPTRSVITSKEITRTKADLRVETLETSNRTPPDEFGGIITPTRSVITSKEITRTKADLRVETLETSNRTPPDEFGGIITPTRSVITSKEITRTKADLRVETLESSNQTSPDEFGGITTPTRSVMTSKQITRTKSDLRSGTDGDSGHNTTEIQTTSPRMDINAIIALIANLTYDYAWNLTEEFNKSLIDHGVPTCPTPTAPTSLSTSPPLPYDVANSSVMGKCFVCGLKSTEIPVNAHCADAFAGDFLPMMPTDARARGQIASYRKYCRFLDVRNYVEDPMEPRSIYGRFTGGCGVRWTDLTGVYTQRTCRVRFRPLMGLHFASKRMAKLELALINVENGCIISPMASLLPMSRGVSLYARFHACVCTGSWCNRAAQAQLLLFTMLACWVAHYTFGFRRRKGGIGILFLLFLFCSVKTNLII